MSERYMWSYWRDKHGAVDALKDHFPDEIKNDFRLATAVVLIEGAMLLIDKIMSSDE